MTKSKTTKLNPFGGTMVVTKNKAVHKTVTQSKWFLAVDSNKRVSEQALSQSATPYLVGSQLAGDGDNTTLAALGLSAVQWAQKYDCYTIDEIEYSLILTTKDDLPGRTLPVVVYAFEDRDSPAEVGCNWDQVNTRQNVAKVVLRANNPCLTIAKIRPVPLFDAGTSGESSPDNVVPSTTKWIDSLAVKQRFNGIRYFSCCPARDQSGQSYVYELYLEKRVKVTARSAL